MRTRQAFSLVLLLSLGVGLHHLLYSLPHRVGDRFSPDRGLLPSPPLEAPSSPVVPDEAQSPPVLPPRELAVISRAPGLTPSFTLEVLNPTLARAVAFWKKVYSTYDSSEVILHDTHDFSIYRVLDFSSLKGEKLPAAAEEKIRESRIRQELARLGDRLSPDKAARLRAQTGLRDKFARALQRSGRYLSHFEAIFAAYGLPVELTRLVFVESLFQEGARSRVGAGGLWQFMPSTARIHGLKVSRTLDERFDPLRACQGAARLLKSSYEELGSWPLAITAYNTGVGHMRRAVRVIGTTDLGRIIELYQSPGFGFASRNFYAEFLAALDVQKNADQYFSQVLREPPLAFDLIQLPVSASFSELAFWANTTVEELRDLNPSYSSSVFEGRYLLSAGTEVRIPPRRGDLFAARFVRYYRQERDLPDKPLSF